MNRRDLLRWAGAAGALAVAGCVAENENDGSDTAGGQNTDSTPTPDPDSTDDGDGNDGEGTISEEEEGTGEDSETSQVLDHTDPVAVVEAFVTAWQEGDVETANSLLYEDGNFEPIPEGDADEISEYAPTIEEVTDVTEDGETATVVGQLLLPDAEESRSNTFELTAVDGEWKIADVVATAYKYAPKVQFDSDWGDGDITITHESGDAVPADELFVRGEGLGEIGAWHELSDEVGADDDVQAGDSVTIEVENEYTINIVWEDGDHSADLVSMSGASESESASESDSSNESNSASENPVDSYLAETDNYDGTIEDFTGEDEVVVQVGDVGEYDQVYVFDPAAIRIDPGTEVVWEWVGDSGHSVAHEGEAFASDVVHGEGETFSHTFEENGTYLYHCEPHKSLNHKGAVVVE